MPTARRRHKQPRLYTIGYSGHTPESFIKALQSQGIQLLLDIRLTPISRKKGFSKTALSQSLYDAGISYTHVRKLGSPRSLRERLIVDKNYAAFFDAYREYLAEQSDSMTEAIALVRQDKVCLMCVEAEPHECHRNVVANAIAARLNDHIAIKHIRSPISLPSKTAKAVKY